MVKQDITNKKQVDVTRFQLKFDNGRNNNREWEVKIIYDSGIYARELDNQLSGFYYLVS